MGLRRIFLSVVLAGSTLWCLGLVRQAHSEEKAGAGDKASYGAEAYLLIGDGHRELRHNDAAVKAYKRYLELAPADARAARAEVERHIANLGGK